MRFILVCHRSEDASMLPPLQPLIMIYSRCETHPLRTCSPTCVALLPCLEGSLHVCHQFSRKPAPKWWRTKSTVACLVGDTKRLEDSMLPRCSRSIKRSGPVGGKIHSLVMSTNRPCVKHDLPLSCNLWGFLLPSILVLCCFETSVNLQATSGIQKQLMRGMLCVA